jgi:hypothetical protein
MPNPVRRGERTTGFVRHHETNAPTPNRTGMPVRAQCSRLVQYHYVMEAYCHRIVVVFKINGTPTLGSAPGVPEGARFPIASRIYPEVCDWSRDGSVLQPLGQMVLNSSSNGPDLSH